MGKAIWISLVSLLGLYFVVYCGKLVFVLLHDVTAYLLFWGVLKNMSICTSLYFSMEEIVHVFELKLVKRKGIDS